MENCNKKKNIIIVLSASFTAAVIFMIFAAVNGLFPFGSSNILRNDAASQYVPFLNEFVSRIKEGSSLLYSFSDGGGTNFYATICYYLINPFNLLAIPFNTQNMDKAFTLIIFVQTLFIAASFAYYLIKKFNKHDLSVAVFAVLYTFCGFFMAYYYNTMWLNAMILLPFVALGIEKIVAGKGGAMYLVSLTLAIITSFYMGYMLCLFSVLYFFVLLFSNPITSKNQKTNKINKKDAGEASVGNVIFKYAAFSLFSGLLSAFVLLPVYCALSTSAAKSVFTDHSMLFNALDFLTYHLNGIKIPTLINTAGTAPYVASGILTFCLLPLYLFTKSIKWNEKIASFILIVILFLSMQIPDINMVWHGFAEPSLLPYRFTYIYSFVIIVIAYKTYLHIKEVPLWTFLIPTVLTSVAIVYSFFTQFKDYIDKKGIIVSAVAFVIFAVLLILKKYEKLNVRVITSLLLVSVIAEISIGQEINFLLREDAEINEIYPYISEMNEVSEDISQSDNALFYRTETSLKSGSLDLSGRFYHTNTMTTFSSLNDKQFSQVQYMMGNAGNLTNSYSYKPQSPIYNALFDLKYIYDIDNVIDQNSPYYENVGEYSGHKLYKNTYCLPLGYMADANVQNWKAPGLALTTQSSLWNTITNAGAVYNYFEPDKVDYINCSAVDFDQISEYTKNNFEESEEHGHDHGVDETGADVEHGASIAEQIVQSVAMAGGTYPFKVSDNDYGVNIVFTATADGEVFLLKEISSLTKIDIVRSDGTTTTFTYNPMSEFGRNVIDAGYFKSGETFTVKFYSPARTVNDFNDEYPFSDSVFIQAATLNQDVFETGYNQIIENGTLNMTEFDEDYIKGTVNAANDGVMMMSMPQDKGWTIFVDGKETEQLENPSHILMFNVGEGDHTIEMKFFPAGLKEGLFVSGASLLALVLFSVLLKLRKNRKDEPIEIAEEENLDADFVRKSQAIQDNTDSENLNSDNTKE